MLHLLALSTLAVVLQVGVASAGADALLEPAHAALRGGRTSEAARLFAEIAASHPFVVDAHLGLAEALTGQGRNADAARALVMGSAQMQSLGLMAESAPLLERAEALAPDFAAVHYFRGAALAAAGDHASAAVAFGTALELGDTQIATRLSLAAALWEAGALEASERQYRDAIEFSGRDPIAVHQLGSLLLWQGRHAEAAELLQEAVERSRPASDRLRDLSSALEATGDLDGALRAARAAVDVSPDDARARYRLATLLARSGARDAANVEIAVYRRLADEIDRLDLESARARAALEEGRARLARGDAGGALEALAGSPESIELLETRAAAQSALQRHDAAVVSLERALALDPQRRDIQLWLARARVAARGR